MGGRWRSRVTVAAPAVAGLVISGHTESETRKQRLHDPRIYYRPKPFNHDELRDAIAEAIRRVRVPG